MAVLSFSNEHEAGASIVINGKIVAAINEERLTRVKNQGGFPEQSIKEVLRLAKLKPEEITEVIIPEISKVKDLFSNVIRQYPKNLFAKGTGKLPGFADIIRHLLMTNFILFQGYTHSLVTHRRDEKRLKKMFPNAKFHRVEHHITHAASAFFTSGFKKSLIISADYWGDFVTTMLSVGESKKITPIAKSYFPASLGHYYASVTKWLGFKANRHEGKILGLAAYGNPNSPAYDMMRDIIECDGLSIKAPFMIGKLWHHQAPILKKNCMMQKMIDNYSREDISAVFQRRFEEVITDLVRNAVKQFKIENIVLAGGSFSNVKLNQRIFEVEGIERVFIFPNMTDGGIASGAALYYDINQNGSYGATLDDVYFGPGFTNEEIEEELKKNNLKFERYDNIERKIAELLAEEHVIARFNGKMEYGPRALGNRSILYQATDPTVNDWLNKKLQRTEFMPFAPVTLKEYADECYINLKGAEYPSRFMTITFDCTNYMKKVSPATVHVDGTARPQIIEESENPSYYKILKEYHKITGIPTIINTSFNMHEEPIVCTPKDAIRAFLQGHLEYLAIGDFLVKHESGEKHVPGEREVVPG